MMVSVPRGPTMSNGAVRPLFSQTADVVEVVMCDEDCIKIFHAGASLGELSGNAPACVEEQ